MEIIRSLEQLHNSSHCCVIALGTFDGLHRGHCDVITTARQYARDRGAQLAVFTFSNHPLSLISPDSIPVPLLTTLQKYLCLEKIGVDVMLDIPFDERLARLTPAEFLAKLRPLRYDCLVVGANFSFGWRGEGTCRTLEEFGGAQGFNVLVRPLVSCGGTVISSTEIRRLILAGEVAAANQMLGRVHALASIVVKGEQRGRLLGFPTANIDLGRIRVAVPSGGVYAVSVKYAGRVYEGMANIGTNPTFGGLAQPRLEVHLFGFSGNLYGQRLRVAFHQRIRGEKSFAAAAGLRAHVRYDGEACRTFFANLQNNSADAQKHLPVFP